MKVEIWSDYACPFCYIGKRNFEGALDKFKGKDDVEISYSSFQLNPYTRKTENADINSIIAKKYGITYEKSKEMNDGIVAKAKEVGLNYNFENLIPNNTADAHRLAKYAKSIDKEDVIVERLLKAYFVDSLDIGDINVLGDISLDVGINKIDVISMLEGNSYKDDVKAEREKAADLGVTSVPFFVFNNKYAVSGAQPSKVFLDLLEKVYSEMDLSSEDNVDVEDDNKCSNGTCSM